MLTKFPQVSWWKGSFCLDESGNEKRARGFVKKDGINTSMCSVVLVVIAHNYVQILSLFHTCCAWADIMITLQLSVVLPKLMNSRMALQRLMSRWSIHHRCNNILVILVCCINMCKLLCGYTSLRNITTKMGFSSTCENTTRKVTAHGQPSHKQKWKKLHVQYLIVLLSKCGLLIFYSWIYL